MLGTLALLKDHSFGSEEARRALDLIRASSREQHRLIDEVRDVSCISAGCFTVTKSRVASLSSIVNTEVDALRVIAGAKRVQLESFVDSGAGPLEADAERLRQVVHNLLSHAIACTPAGGNVIVECHGRKDHAELVVRDNGMGIAADSLPHLFDAGWQMQRARAEGGRTGGVWLGLAVVHQIVELHGGRIVASSGGPGMGAVFTVRLPLTAVTHTDTMALGVAQAPASAKSNGRIDAR
jgi:signal transduction histidine kinase